MKAAVMQSATSIRGVTVPSVDDKEPSHLGHALIKYMPNDVRVVYHDIPVWDSISMPQLHTTRLMQIFALVAKFTQGLTWVVSIDTEHMNYKYTITAHAIINGEIQYCRSIIQDHVMDRYRPEELMQHLTATIRHEWGLQYLSSDYWSQDVS